MTNILPALLRTPLPLTLPAWAPAWSHCVGKALVLAPNGSANVLKLSGGSENRFGTHGFHLVLTDHALPELDCHMQQLHAP